MKKLIILTGMLFTVISLAACGGDENLEALELLERSHEAQAELGSMIMEMDAEINMIMIGMSIDMPMTMRMEMESAERTRMDMNMSVMGMDMDMAMFLRDGYMYTETNLFGQVERERAAVGLGTNEAMEMAGLFDTTFIVEAMVEYSSAEQTDNGYRLELLLNMDGVMSFLGNMELIDDLIEIDEEEVDDWNVEMIMYIDEDYLPISTELTMEFDMTVEGMDSTMEMHMMMRTLQLGNVTIDFPDWLDELD